MQTDWLPAAVRQNLLQLSSVFFSKDQRKANIGDSFTYLIIVLLN